MARRADAALLQAADEIERLRAENERLKMNKLNFVLCRSDTGDGGWSLHAPGSTDEEIGSGDAPYLVSGPAGWDEEKGDWSRPDEADYRAAAEAYEPVH